MTRDPDCCPSSSCVISSRFQVGALWTDASGGNLYQYGGELSDSPNVPPPAESIYQYNIASANWTQIVTTGDTIQRAAEGAVSMVLGGGTGDNMGYCESSYLYSTYRWIFSDVIRLCCLPGFVFSCMLHETVDVSASDFSGHLDDHTVRSFICSSM